MAAFFADLAITELSKRPTAIEAVAAAVDGSRGGRVSPLAPKTEAENSGSREPLPETTRDRRKEGGPVQMYTRTASSCRQKATQLDDDKRRPDARKR
jgi:hypothetical protein